MLAWPPTEDSTSPWVQSVTVFFRCARSRAHRAIYNNKNVTDPYNACVQVSHDSRTTENGRPHGQREATQTTTNGRPHGQREATRTTENGRPHGQREAARTTGGHTENGSSYRQREAARTTGSHTDPGRAHGQREAAQTNCGSFPAGVRFCSAKPAAATPRPPHTLEALEH